LNLNVFMYLICDTDFVPCEVGFKFIPLVYCYLLYLTDDTFYLIEDPAYCDLIIELICRFSDVLNLCLTTCSFSSKVLTYY